jgi:TonB family protein
MNCTDVAAILDEHALGRLSAADRCALDEHVVSCESCALAWNAQHALLALPPPATPPNLLGRVLRAVSSRPAQAARRARMRIVLVGAVLAAGAALAAATAVRLLERSSEPVVRSDPTSGTSSPAAPSTGAEPRPGSTENAGTAAPAVDVQYVDVAPFLVLRTAPVYPPDALQRKLDGVVVLRFTIDEHGIVKDPEVVQSSDSIFEAAAIASLSQWKYLPRVSAGKRVAVVGTQTAIRFVLDMSHDQLKAAQADSISRSTGGIPTPDQPRYAEFQAVERGIAVAWQRVADDDLRGAELELDELRATYDLVDFQVNAVWLIYGYIYIQYGDYGRAIDAYENAVAANKGRWTEPWTALANLYFARHQYAMALRTLLRFKEQAGKIGPEATALLEKLQALGVTEDTL